MKFTSSISMPVLSLVSALTLSVPLVAQTQPTTWPYVFSAGPQPYGNRFLVAFRPDVPPFDDRTAVQRFELVALSQPDPWVYSYFGGSQPYGPKTLSPGIPGQSADQPPFDRRAAEANAEVVALNQPSVWPYTFPGGRQPYGGPLVPPSVEDNPPPPPGAGKRYKPPTAYLPEPAYEVPAKPKSTGFYERLAAGEKRRRDADAARPVVPAPQGPPPIPQIAAPPTARPAALPTASVGQPDADADEALDTRDAMEAISMLMKMGML